MVELFDIEVNIANYNHKEVLIFDHNCYKRHLGSPRFEITCFHDVMTSRYAHGLEESSRMQGKFLTH